MKAGKPGKLEYDCAVSAPLVPIRIAAVKLARIHDDAIAGLNRIFHMIDGEDGASSADIDQFDFFVPMKRKDLLLTVQIVYVIDCERKFIGTVNNFLPNPIL
jgi:hypothetical protein